MRIKFLSDFVFENEGRNAGETFTAGDVKEFRDDIAERFIRRGVAEKVGKQAAAQPPAPPAKPQEPPKSEQPPPAPAPAPPAKQ